MRETVSDHRPGEGITSRGVSHLRKLDQASQLPAVAKDFVGKWEKRLDDLSR
jgi:hypothetical protein